MANEIKRAFPPSLFTFYFKIKNDGGVRALVHTRTKPAVNTRLDLRRYAQTHPDPLLRQLAADVDVAFFLIAVIHGLNTISMIGDVVAIRA